MPSRLREASVGLLQVHGRLPRRRGRADVGARRRAARGDEGAASAGGGGGAHSVAASLVVARVGTPRWSRARQQAGAFAKGSACLRARLWSACWRARFQALGGSRRRGDLGSWTGLVAAKITCGFRSLDGIVESPAFGVPQLRGKKASLSLKRPQLRRTAPSLRLCAARRRGIAGRATLKRPPSRGIEVASAPRPP